MSQPSLPKRDAADRIQESVWICRETNHNALKLSGSAQRCRPAGVAFNL